MGERDAEKRKIRGLGDTRINRDVHISISSSSRLHSRLASQVSIKPFTPTFFTQDCSSPPLDSCISPTLILLFTLSPPPYPLSSLPFLLFLLLLLFLLSLLPSVCFFLRYVILSFPPLIYFSRALLLFPSSSPSAPFSLSPLSPHVSSCLTCPLSSSPSLCFHLL